MEGRRRRAQRLTQEEAESLKIRQQDEPEQEETASLNHPDQSDESNMRRRRRQTWETSQESVHEKNERPISRMPLKAPKTHRGEQFRTETKKRGKNLSTMLSGLIVLVLMAAQEGLKKLSHAVEKMSGSAKKLREAQRETAVQEYEITPVRPEEYHGRGKAHAQQATADTQRHAKKKSSAKNTQLFNRIASMALACVALFSAWQIGSILLRSLRTTRLNEELSQQRAAIIQEQQEMSEKTMFLQPEAAQEPHMIAAQETDPAAPAVTALPDIVKMTKYRHMGGDALPEMAALYEKNRDLVAWIQIPEVLDLPVVYRNNDYYLTRDFNKQKNASGTIFLDVNHPFKEKTQNLLLHGHNMKDGTMFGRLAQYLHDDTYLRYHPFIYFDTLWNKEQYVIFAILNVSLKPNDPRFFNYFTHDTFSSDREFSTYVRQLQLRSQYAIPIDVVPSDALLTLSTCLEEDRLVIVARRLRENETRSELREMIRMATKQ